MSKHTPGPWTTCNTANIFTKLGAPNAEGTNAPSNDGWMIADCDMGSLSLAEARANTLLIAAAPELLECCKKTLALLKEISQLMQCDENGVGPDCTNYFQTQIDLAATIAKATGAQT